VSAAASSETRRLEYYARFLDDERLSPEERAQIARHLNFLLGANTADPEEARQHFLPFARQVWPKFIEGRHHHVMAEVVVVKTSWRHNPALSDELREDIEHLKATDPDE
jgi:hypothetical protein